MQRLNNEIMRQTVLGKQGLPPLQTGDRTNGLVMFGFLSPHIIQVKSLFICFVHCPFNTVYADFITLDKHNQNMLCLMF